MGWIGVDLDGTLAAWGPGENEDVTVIGRPIPKMVDRVKGWLAEGKDVRIVTARVQRHADASLFNMSEDAFVSLQRAQIQYWCAKHFGVVLPITCEKDYQMEQLWDDRCVQVIPNTGERADGGP